ncbi:MAG: septum formation initiator family protein [Lachnospiraceae bacterium]|nr:septum formation initiator family protein [Lachnospiraceae bacterium]
MAKQHIREKRAGKRSVRLIVIFALILAAVLTIRVIGLYKENQDLSYKIEALKENVERVSEEHKELEERRSKPLSDEEMLRLARDRFGLAFPNEIILVPEE